MHKNKRQNKFRGEKRNTSWEKSSKWYNKLVGGEGHYYHQNLILPGVLRLFDLKKDSSVIDFGCGQGVLARQLPKEVYYQGVDLSRSLISAAQKEDRNSNHHYIVADATVPMVQTNVRNDFTHAAAILSMQNMERPEGLIKNVAAHVRKGGKFVVVLNHPYFRIPRQSGWGTNPENKLQYRWVAKYMSEMKIPIQMHPGEQSKELTWSFHTPLSTYSKMFKESGLAIELIEEWVSDKKSTNKAENVSKAEIPLFMAI